MERKLHHEPSFDTDALRQKVDTWKSGGATRIVFEWSTGTGPTVFYYPAGERKVGVKWTVAVETYNYNEIYADFIESTLLPRLEEIARSRGLDATVLNVDLQPLQVQRQRRRQIERQIARQIAQTQGAAGASLVCRNERFWVWGARHAVARRLHFAIQGRAAFVCAALQAKSLYLVANMCTSAIFSVPNAQTFFPKTSKYTLTKP